MPAKRIKNLYGLVLAGGQSKRMHTDKAKLLYHGKPQADVSFDLLMQFCKKVFVSSRKGQTPRDGQQGHPTIYDKKKYTDIGPLAGILSAMERHPQAVWLILACDLPFVTAKTLQALLAKRDPQKMATAFRSAHDGLPEPLCAIYEPKAHAQILKFLKQNIHCPRKIMINSDVKLLKLSDKIALDNINTPSEYRVAVRHLKTRG